MTHAFQFVDSIASSPTVLLDLDNGTPFTVQPDSSVSPPTLRRTTAQGIRSDGDLEVATSYDDREITLTLAVDRLSAESQATSIQTLARILDRREGAWLKWQSEGMAKPRFFRTRRASFDTIDTILNATPYRTLKLTLDANPFGYGLPESGSFVVTNDPSSSMIGAFPTIKGDVPSRLVLTWLTPDGVHRTHIASFSDYTGFTPTGPDYFLFTTPTINSSPPTGWTIADAADSSTIGGNRRRLTKTSGTAMARPNLNVVEQWASPKPGDYRVMVRTNGATAGTEILFFNRPPSTGTDLIYSEAVGKAVVTATTTGRDWLDLGVVALPGGAPITDVATGLAGAVGPALWGLGVNMTGATGRVDLDAIAFIPASRPNLQARIGTVAFPSTYTSRSITWDGVNYRRFGSGISTYTAGVSSVMAPYDVTGGNPIVCPGASNVLFFFATTADTSVAARLSDSKAPSTLINWSYFPQYLYERPTAT